jgi:ATP-binding cassette subfamily B protein
MGWAFSLAWRFNKVLLVVWFFLISIVSVLPATALSYNKQIISLLDGFILTGNGSFNDLLPTIFVFGIITTLIGLSNRLNMELIYSIMYDSYYFGMEEVLMDSVQSFSMEELLKKDTNDEYHACVMREGSLTDFISGVCSLLGKFVGLFSLLIVAFTLSEFILIFSMVYIIGVIWMNLKYIEKRRRVDQGIRDQERLSAHYEGMPYSAEYAKEIRVFGTKDKIIDDWKEIYAELYKHGIKNSFAAQLRSFISGFGFYIFLFAMLIYSLSSVANGSMTAAVLLTIYSLCMTLHGSMPGIASTMLYLDHGLFALERQYRIFGLHKMGKKKEDATAEPNKNTKNNETVFEVKNLSYSYNDNKPTLDDVSLTISKGETIALVGMNGSGKSTLVKLILQLYKPRSGELFYNGTNYNQLEDGFLKNHIGAFFQDYYLFHLPIWENIGFGDIENVDNKEKINKAMEKGGSSQFISALPKESDTYVYRWIEETGADFSGGEKQKLAISRAHMSDKEILIFDEPASMLDPISELEQFMNIKEKAGDCTSILISHRVGFARLADKIILLDGGKVAEIGSHEELMEKNGLYAKFFNEQAQWYVKKDAEVVCDA